jgi:hypothetical protein
MLRQIRRFKVDLEAESGLELANEFLRQLHGSGVQSIEVLAVPGARGTDRQTDTIYVVFEPADEPGGLAAIAVADAAVEILEPDEVADVLAPDNGHSLPVHDRPA